jgi:hypothetical protein
VSAAATLGALALAGVGLRADGRRLALVARRPLPASLAAEVRAAAPKLLRVASGAWRQEVEAWPAWRLDFFKERAAIRWADGGLPADLADRLAFLDALEQPEPPAAPELPPGTDPDAPEALAQGGAEGEGFPGLAPGPCPGCSTLTIAVTGLGFCAGCGWVKLPAPIAPVDLAEPPHVDAGSFEGDEPAPELAVAPDLGSGRPRRPWAPALDPDGAELCAVDTTADPAPSGSPLSAPSADDPGALDAPAPPLPALPPFRWAAVLAAMPPEPPRPVGPWRWLHPLDPRPGDATTSAEPPAGAARAPAEASAARKRQRTPQRGDAAPSAPPTELLGRGSQGAQTWPAGLYPAEGYPPPLPPPPGWGWTGNASCGRCRRRGQYLGPRGHHCPTCDGLPDTEGASR